MHSATFTTAGGFISASFGSLGAGYGTVNATHQVSYGLALGFFGFPVGGDFGWANGSRTNVRMDGVVARVGVNYHFNWGAPAAVLAKY